MEELLRQAFQLGQQWVQDMNNEKEPMNFNEWYVSDKVQKQLQLGGVSKLFLVTYKYTNRTDAALHEDEVEARNCVEACNKVCANHNYEVEWYTVKDAS